MEKVIDEPINDAYMQLMEEHEKPEMARLILRLEDQIGAREKRIKELEATLLMMAEQCDTYPYHLSDDECAQLHRVLGWPPPAPRVGPNATGPRSQLGGGDG